MKIKISEKHLKWLAWQVRACVYADIDRDNEIYVLDYNKTTSGLDFELVPYGDAVLKILDLFCEHILKSYDECLKFHMSLPPSLLQNVRGTFLPMDEFKKLVTDRLNKLSIDCGSIVGDDDFFSLDSEGNIHSGMTVGAFTEDMVGTQRLNLYARGISLQVRKYQTELIILHAILHELCHMAVTDQCEAFELKTFQSQGAWSGMYMSKSQIADLRSRFSHCPVFKLTLLNLVNNIGLLKPSFFEPIKESILRESLTLYSNLRSQGVSLSQTLPPAYSIDRQVTQALKKGSKLKKSDIFVPKTTYVVFAGLFEEAFEEARMRLDQEYGRRNGALKLEYSVLDEPVYAFAGEYNLMSDAFKYEDPFDLVISFISSMDSEQIKIRDIEDPVYIAVGYDPKYNSPVFLYNNGFVEEPFEITLEDLWFLLSM